MSTKNKKQNTTDTVKFYDDYLEWFRYECERKYFLLESREAMSALAAGIPIRRATWLGYWQIVDGRLEIHCKDGRIVTLRDCDAPMMLINASNDDWIQMLDCDKRELDHFHELVRKERAEYAKAMQAMRSVALRDVKRKEQTMKTLTRILVTALAFCVGVALMPLAPFALAYVFWTSEEED